MGSNNNKDKEGNIRFQNNAVELSTAMEHATGLMVSLI